MEIILVVGMAATAWAFLCVLSGEQKRLGQKFDATHPTKTAAPVESKAGHREKSK